MVLEQEYLHLLSLTVINLKYVNFDPKLHDTYKVAKYVYDVDFRTFDMLFKDEKQAILTIEKDLKKHKPESNFKVILNDDGELIGMLMAYISKMSIIEFRLKPLKLIIVDILDYFVLCDVKKGDLYVAEIAIDDSTVFSILSSGLYFVSSTKHRPSTILIKISFLRVNAAP